jgi:redox-sensitive bicupin YhaK (pirin superfamily)
MVSIKKVYKTVETMEGAGVRLNRVFGYNETPQFDPFLMLDYFASNNPDDVMKGFPWHPHRGIETITYMLKGEIEHQDSLGNKGIISKSEVQWMTAGSGIIHQEMPLLPRDGLEGFQFWLNLPSDEKMTDPQYGDITADMLEIHKEDGLTVKVIGGSYNDARGPVQRDRLSVNLLDIELDGGRNFIYELSESLNAFVFVFHGTGKFGVEKQTIGEKTAVRFNNSGKLQISTSDGVRFILAEGKPIAEPIAWGGPIVMNTREELQTAFREYENNTFLKHKKP